MIILTLVLILFILVYAVRISNNNDIIKKNCKTKEDLENIQKAKKQCHLTKVSKALFGISIILLICFLLADFTSFEAIIIDYFSFDFYTEKEFDRMFYFIPIFTLVSNLIYCQVNIGEYLLKYFKTEEEELIININKEKLLSILYKKKPNTTNQETEKKSEK